MQYAYNVQGALETYTDAANRVTTYSYVQGRFAPLLSQITDNWNRVITDVTYDSTDRVHSYTENGETYTYTYGYGGNNSETAKTDSQGNLSLYPFAGEGFVSDTIPPAGGPTHTDRYPDGSIQQLIDPVGVKTYFTYTADGNPLAVTRDYQGPNAIRVDYAYDPNFASRVVSITPRDPATNQANPDWESWQYDYYQSGSPAPGALFHVYRIRSDGVTRDTLATYIYNAHGQVTRHTTATGGATDYGYDAQLNLRTLTLPANNDSGTRPVITYGYDALGRVTSVTDALTHQTTYQYDNLDRATVATLPKPSASSTLNFTTTYVYDNFDSSSGLLFLEVTDPNARVAKRGYDQFGQVRQEADEAGNLAQYSYTKGLLVSVTDANNNVTTYGYDAARRLHTTTFPDGAVETYNYTADSLLDTKKTARIRSPTTITMRSRD